MVVEYPPAKRVCRQLSSNSLYEDALDYLIKDNEELELSPMRPIPSMPNLLGLYPTTTVITNYTTEDENLIGDIAAESLSHFTEQVNLDNEILIRTLHRSLRNFSEVFVHEGSGRPIWVVDETNNFNSIKDTHAGGREIHLLPRPYSPPPNLPFREDPINRLINCRRLLSNTDLRIIRNYFPGSSGVWTLICGFVFVLFPNEHNLKNCLAKGIVPSIGGQRARYLVPEYRSTAATVQSGYALSNKPEDFSTNGCLGLRLRLRSGQEVITTTTHAFVRLCVNPTPFKIKLAEYYIAIRNKLAFFRGDKEKGSEPAIAETRKRKGNSPLGTVVWLAGTNIRIGTITTSYDPHPIPTALPFPSGFRHDLSLISYDNLPELVNSPNGPLLTGWGSYASVLDGGSVFMSRINVATRRWRHLTGSGVSRPTQVAIAAGAEHLWESAAVPPTTSLLWRTPSNADTAQGYSGSVLCLGKPTDPTALAVAFQNFESALKPRHGLSNQKGVKDEEVMWFKAGFLLPAEIREATIQMGYESPIIEPKSLNPAARLSKEDHRRILTNP